MCVCVYIYIFFFMAASNGKLLHGYKNEKNDQTVPPTLFREGEGTTGGRQL